MAARDRIPVTHVGSLPRPPRLLEFIEAEAAGREIDGDAFEACLAESVADAVRRQVDAGVDIVSDGEFGKFRTWSGYVLERLGGLEEREAEMPVGTGKDQSRFPEFYAEYFPTQRIPKRRVVACVGPIAYAGESLIRRDIRNLKSAIEGLDVAGAFLPLVAPASATPQFVDEYYGSERDYLFGLAEALRAEYRAVIDAGLLLQVDDAFLPYMYDFRFADEPLEVYREWAEVRIDALNHALEGLPEDRVRYHICWGSFNVPHTADIPLSDIVDLVFRVKAGAYLLEMANPRHQHEWRVFEEVALPAGKTLVPGAVGHATNVVEHPELVAERLLRLAELTGRDNLMAGTDCGFAQSPFTNRVHPSIVWAKLRALADGAEIASRQLWPDGGG